MGSPHILTITSGAVGLAPVPTGGASLNLATVPCYCSATTEASLTPTSNTTDVAATFCSPASSKAVLSSWALTFNTLQDWGRVDGHGSLSEWLYENDGGDAIAVLYLDDNTTVKAVALVSVVAGQFGGAAGTSLASSTSLPVQGTPDIYKTGGGILRHGAGGSSTASIPISGELSCDDVDATGFTAPTSPALLWKLSPVGSVWPAHITSLATLQTDTVLGNTGSAKPSRAFTTGEYIVGPAGIGNIHYTTTWNTGTKP